MKVSIVIPLYNGEAYLSTCLESILNQDYGNYEVLIIDDGSSDASLALARKFESEKIQVLSQRNAGPSAARNLGIENCSQDSKCVFFVDCDDCLNPRYLSTLLSNYDSERANLPFCELAYVGENESLKLDDKPAIPSAISFRNYWENESFLELFTRGLMNSSCNKCFSLDVIRNNDLRFEEAFPEDSTFNLEYLKYVNEVTYISYPLYYYIKRVGSITGRAYPELYDGYLRIQKELYTRVPENLHTFVHEFVYPQYLVSTRKFLANGDLSTPIPYLKNRFVKTAIKAHKSTCIGDFIVKKLLEFRLLRFLSQI